MAFTIPSPPSATGRHRHSTFSKHSRADWEMISQTSSAERDPLKESGAINNFKTKSSFAQN